MCRANTLAYRTRWCDFKTVTNGCAKPGRESRAYVEWFFGRLAEPGRRGEILGIVRFVLFCGRDENGTGTISTAVVYQSEAGINMRSAELATKEANY